MTIKMEQMRSRQDWLKKRTSYIGGSDASSIVGKNPYLSNVDLWEIKTGRRKPDNIDDKTFVKYGHDAEPYLRALFGLDFPDFKVNYVENNIWLNDELPFAHASLDAWLTDKDGRLGILEIKTTNILQSMQKEKWHDRIPDNYYVQVLHYMAVLNAEFAVLKAQLKFDYGGDIMLTTRHYWIERSDVEADIEYLINAERDFAQAIKEDRRPALLLPDVI